MTTLNEALTLFFKGDSTHYSKTLGGMEDKAKSSSKKIAGHFGGILKTLTKIGVAGAAAFTGIAVVAIKKAGDAEKAFAELGGLFRKDIGDLQEYKQAIDRISISMGKSAVETTKGYYQAISAGFRTIEDATGVVEASMRAAIAGSAELPVAVEAITRVLNAYNMSGKDAGKVSDLLFQTVNYGVTTFEQLAPQIGMVAGMAAKANVPMEEMFATIATMTKAMPTAETITSLNGMIAGFIKPTEDAAKAAKGYGIELSAAGLATHGLVGSLQQMTALGPEALAELFPNIRALRGVMVATAQGGAELAANLKAMGGAADATGNAFRKMENTFNFQFGKLMNTISETMRMVGEQFLPELKMVLNWLNTEGTAKIMGWVETVKTAMTAWRTEFTEGTMGKDLKAKIGVMWDDFIQWFKTKGQPGIVAAGLSLGKAFAEALKNAIWNTLKGLSLKDLWDLLSTGPMGAWKWATKSGGNVPGAYAGYIPNYARGNVSEYSSLLRAYEREKRMGPAGSRPVIANDSEYIIPSRYGGHVPNMAGGSGDLFAEAKLTNSLLMKQISLTADQAGLMQKLFDQIIHVLDKLQEPLEVKLPPKAQFWGQGSGIPHFAGGGAVYGPPGTDNIPAMLTAGERVLNVDDANVFGPLIDAIKGGGGNYHDVSEQHFHFGDRFSDRLMTDRVIPALQQAKRRGMYNQARRW